MKNSRLYRAEYDFFKLNQHNQRITNSYTVFMVAKNQDQVTYEIYRVMGKNNVWIKSIDFINKIDHFSDECIQELTSPNTSDTETDQNCDYPTTSMSAADKLLEFIAKLKK